jgi:hypothetical protein
MIQPVFSLLFPAVDLFGNPRACVRPLARGDLLNHIPAYPGVGSCLNPCARDLPIPSPIRECPLGNPCRFRQWPTPGVRPLSGDCFAEFRGNGNEGRPGGIRGSNTEKCSIDHDPLLVTQASPPNFRSFPQVRALTFHAVFPCQTPATTQKSI